MASGRGRRAWHGMAWHAMQEGEEVWEEEEDGGRRGWWRMVRAGGGEAKDGSEAQRSGGGEREGQEGTLILLN